MDQQRANANRKGSRRMRNADDHDAMSMGATTVVGWAEARHGRRVEVARRDAARALAAIPASAAERELGRSLFVAYEPAPRRWLFELDAPIVAAGEAAILRDVRLAVGARARIWITGDNGAGKSTLLGALLAQHRLPPDRVLYLPQELDDDAGPRLLERVAALPSEARGRTLSLVAALGVDPDRLLASCAPSPGEARKLALAFGLATHAWCLVLDEPTNHLDLPAIERLESALAAYPGALVLVSHDARFARACTTERWQLAAGRVEAAVRATAG